MKKKKILKKIQKRLENKDNAWALVKSPFASGVRYAVEEMLIFIKRLEDKL